jgi:type I restriction enzyme S subunit
MTPFYKRPDTNGAKIMNNEMASIYCLIPPIQEQIKIAQYLDHQTAIIDQLIQQKEKLIELLKEKRQAVINEAVTKGLNPNAKMKDSGIEWLGEVPEEWLLTKMKFGCQFIFDGTHGSFSRVDEGYRLLSVRNIIDSKFTFRDDDSRISEKDYKEISTKFEILEDDIQLAIVGATLGKVAIVEKISEPFVTQRSLASIRANSKKCLPKYLFYFLSSNSFQSYLWLSTSFSAQPGVYLGTIQKCTLPLPIIKEQEKIVTYLELEISSIQELLDKINIQIDKLKEYRQSIISEAVTGKIDVRDWVPNKQQVT